MEGGIDIRKELYVKARTITDQLVKYLTDAHSIEVQALAQLRTAPLIAGSSRMASAFRSHLAETEEHEQMVRARLHDLGASRSLVKDVVMAAGGKGFVLFARSQPDTPGKLLAHAYSYEHLELASYTLLERVADAAGDAETAAVARRIAGDEKGMGERLAGCLDEAVTASVGGDIAGRGIERRLVAYLADAHAIETQSVALLERAIRRTEDPIFAGVYRGHLDESRSHARAAEDRLAAHGAGRSVFKDAAMRMGGAGWAGFFGAHPDTPAKLAAFVFAFEHLEIGGYELLSRVAARAGDGPTVEACGRILAQEREAARVVEGLFGRAVDTSLGSMAATPVAAAER
jgi:ferritin-like metal-binding protein YciE